MRISDFLNGLKEAETKQELTPAQQSIDTGVVQTDPVSPITPENETSGETSGASTSGEATPEISKGEATHSPTDAGIDLSKDSDDEGDENVASTGNGVDSPEQDSGDGETDPTDQEDQRMAQEVQQYEAVTEQNFESLYEGFAATVAASSAAPKTMTKAGKLGFLHGYYGDASNVHSDFAEEIGKFSATDKEEFEKHAKRASAMKDKETHRMSEELTFAQQFANSLNEGTEFKLEMKLDGLFESQGFEAEFAGQAKEIFEAAVNDSAKQHLIKVNEYAAYVMESLMTEKIAELEESVESRLNDAIATWTESNKLAIEAGIRTQVTESFMKKLSGLLEEHFVEIPTEKKDIFESKVQEVETIKTQLAESEKEHTKTVSALQEEVRELSKQVAIENFVRGMSLMTAERIRSIAEGITYENEQKFIGKLKILRESYVNKPKSNSVDTLHEDISPVKTEVETVVESGDPEIIALAKKMRT